MMGYYETDKDDGLMSEIRQGMRKIALKKAAIRISEDKLLAQYRTIGARILSRRAEYDMRTLGNDSRYHDPEDGVLAYNIKVPPLTGKTLELLETAACNVMGSVIAKDKDAVQEAVSSSILSGYWECCLRPVSDFQARKAPDGYKKYMNFVHSVEITGRSGGHLIIETFLTQETIDDMFSELENCNTIEDYDAALQELAETVEAFNMVNELDDKIVKSIKHCTGSGLRSYLESLNEPEASIQDYEDQTGNLLLGELRKANS